MDTLPKTMQNFQKPKRKELILEARHSKCIEDSNKIRSKLRPRLFMPRAPNTLHSAKTSYCPKELKTTFFKNQTFTDFAKETTKSVKKSCQNVEPFWKHLREKYTKKTHFKQNYKNIESLTDSINSNLPNKRKNEENKKVRVSKMDKHVGKRIRKQQASFKVTHNSKKIRKTKDVAVESWGNLKVIGNENSSDNIRYLTDGDIIFLNEDEDVKSTHQEDKVINAHHFENNAVDNEMTTKTSESLKTKTKKNKLKKPYNCSDSYGSDGRSLEPSSVESPKGNLNNTINDDVNSQIPAKQNQPEFLNYTDQPNEINKNIRTASKTPSTDKSSNVFTNLQSYVDENYQILENDSLKIKIVSGKYQQLFTKRVENKPETANKTTEAAARCLYTTKSPISPNPETAQKPSYFTSLQHIPPIHNYLSSASSSVAGFQDAVRSSISQIYNCTPNDQDINKDLISLENSIELFSKYLLHTLNEMEAMELKTHKFLEYLAHQNLEKGLRSLNLLSKDEDNLEETLTVLIEADGMPTKTITFKTSDIIANQFNNNQNGLSFLENLKLQTEAIAKCKYHTELKRNNSNVEIFSNIILKNIKMHKTGRSNLSCRQFSKDVEVKTDFPVDSFQTQANSALTENPVNLLQTFVFHSDPESNEENSFQNSKKIGHHSTANDKFNKTKTRKIRKKFTPTKTTKVAENCKNLSTDSQLPAKFITLKEPICGKAKEISTISNTHIENSQSFDDFSLNAPSNNLNPYSQNQDVSNSSIAFKNLNNLISTQQQNSYKSRFLHENPLRSFRVNQSYHTVTSQAAKKSCVTATNVNYSLANHDPYLQKIKPNNSSLYPSLPCLTVKPQVTYGNPQINTNRNSINSNSICITSNNVLNNPNPTAYEYQNANYFQFGGIHYNNEYEKSLSNVPYLHNSYYNQYTCHAYDSQYFYQNPANIRTTNFLAKEPYPNQSVSYTNPL